MKSIVRLKHLWLLTSLSLVSVLVPGCLMEPYFSSKANITPVKLLQVNYKNSSSFHHRSNESVFGSKAKISRVVPISHVTKLMYNNLKSATGSNGNFRNLSSSNVITKKSSLRLEDRHNVTAHYSRVPDQNNFPAYVRSKKYITSSTTATPIISSTTTAVTNVGKNTPFKPIKKDPLFLTNDSWNFLNSAVTDDELRQIINGFPNQVIQNVTNITRHDPVAGQEFLLKTIINELTKLKRSRMLELETIKKETPVVNKGVRYSAKLRKPILNVIPLEQKIKLGKPVKNLIKTGIIVSLVCFV